MSALVHLSRQECAECKSLHEPNLAAVTQEAATYSTSQMEQSSYYHSRQLPQWAQLSSNVSPYPAQAAPENVEVDDMGMVRFRIALFFYLRPREFSF
jgi:hypothetical protein